MDPQLRQDLEALLFVAEEPLGIDTLAEATEQEPAVVEEALEQLRDAFTAEQRGLAVRQVAGGWRLYTSPAAREAVERYALSGRSGRLTQAALETLAVVAYKQPITRQDISDIRGVNADAAVRTLAARDLVEEVGRLDAPGQAILYGTTDVMLERLGLESLDELPALEDFLPESPAPDEPAPGEYRAARERLKDGRALPSTGRTGWTDQDGDGDALPPVQPGPSETHEDMDALSDALERVARSAIDQLREVEEATERAQDPDRDLPEPDDGTAEP